jgi:hypothetical protein
MAAAPPGFTPGPKATENDRELAMAKFEKAKEDGAARARRKMKQKAHDRDYYGGRPLMKGIAGAVEHSQMYTFDVDDQEYSIRNFVLMYIQQTTTPSAVEHLARSKGQVEGRLQFKSKEAMTADVIQTIIDDYRKRIKGKIIGESAAKRLMYSGETPSKRTIATVKWNLGKMASVFDFSEEEGDFVVHTDVVTTGLQLIFTTVEAPLAPNGLTFSDAC